MPEVEILVRHLRPLLRGKTIRRVSVRRERATRPTPPREFEKALAGSKFKGLTRRGKYLLFELLGARRRSEPAVLTMLGHLGMTGRMFVALKKEKLLPHAAVVFNLGDRNFIYEDQRYLGRMTLDLSPLNELGPEPSDFSPETFAAALKQSRQAIKIKLLDQSLIAGVGNIYASEALFRARISPKMAANRLTSAQAKNLLRAIRDVLNDAVELGNTIARKTVSGELFYFSNDGESDYERFRVYDRAGQPCLNKCGSKIQRIIQGARSTYFCPHCQRTR